MAAPSDAEPVLAPSGEGTVVLDIGGECGAVVVQVPAHLEDAEIEIRSADRPWDGTHTGVRRRNLRDGFCFAAVFGAVRSGEYQLRVRGTRTGPVVDLSVAGGGITESTWPEHRSVGDPAVVIPRVPRP